MAEVTMYSTTWCGYCKRLKRQFADAGISFREIDLDEHAEYDDRIAEAAGGYRVVPTIEVGGRLLVNPTVTEVVRLLSV